MSGPWAKVDCTAVPDGIVIGPDGSPRLRLSIVLRPEPTSDAAAIALLDWPTEIANLAFAFRFGADPANLVPIGPAQALRLEPADAAATAPADAWWKRLWSDRDVLGAYVDLMTRESPRAEVESYSHSWLADQARARLEKEIEIGLLAYGYRRRRGTMQAFLADLDLPRAAMRRVEHPADPALRTTQAHALLARDAFGDLPIGDETDVASASLPGGPSALGLGAGTRTRALVPQFQELHGEAARVMAETLRAAGATTEPWTPFPPAQSSAHLSLAGLLEDDWDEALFGSPVLRPSLSEPRDGAGEAQAAFPAQASLARLAMLAADRALMSNEDLGAREAPVDVAVRTASTRLAGLQAHPTLRKFVRLIVDFEIPLSAIPADLVQRGRGVVSVSVEGPAAASAASATAFQLSLAADPALSLFEPCPATVYAASGTELPVPSLPLDQGVVKLNADLRGQAGGKRFRLEVIDTFASLMSMRRNLQSIIRAHRLGAAPSEEVTAPSTLRTRGLMLLDREANVPPEIGKARAAEVARGGPALFHAEDLVDGYRVDLVDSGGRVFPAGARSLGYDVVRAAFASEAHPYPQFAGRDEGYVKQTVRSWTDGDSGQRKEMVSDQIVCWTGNNLGLPTPFQLDGAPPSPSGEELPVVTYCDFAPGVVGPILRVGGRYRFMLRARKINGSSVSTKFSSGLVDAHALGDHERPGGYAYALVEPTPAPTVLVPEGQRLAEQGTGQDQPTSQTILVATGETAAVRMIASPRIGFELAEQLGQFDLVPKAGETGAAARARAARAKAFGAYLALKRGPGGNFPALNPADARSGDALLFKLVRPPAAPPERPEHVYYVDSSLCALGSCLSPTKATPAFAVAAESPLEEVAFWPRAADVPGNGFAPEAVRPIMLEIAATGPRSRILYAGEQVYREGNLSINVPVLRVEVAPGDTLELKLWLNRTAEAMLPNRIFRRAVDNLRTRLADGAQTANVLGGAYSRDQRALETWWADVCRDRPIAMLHDVVEFRIEHPVPTPLQPPRLERLGCVRRSSLVAWGDVARDPRPDERPEEGAEATFSFGSVRIDRKTTGALWAEAIWLEHDPERARRRITTTPQVDDAKGQEIDPRGLWEFAPFVAQGRLFEIRDLPPVEQLPEEGEEAYRNRLSLVDLVFDEAGALRNLSASFRSHKAQRIAVRLLGRSRFAASGPLDGEANTLASATRPDLEAALYGGPQPTGMKGFWLPATRRPAPPKLTKDQGTVYHRHWEDADIRRPGHRGKRLTHLYRCWLDTDWFSSGEGEMLAVVCQDSSQGSQPQWLLDKLSRWGGDMTMAPGAALRPPDFGSGDPTFLDHRQIRVLAPDDRQITRAGEATGELPIPEGSEAGEGSRWVRLALVTPRFDSGTGRWYCDLALALDGAAAFRTSIQLSLARYQEQAIPGCHLSDTVRADAFMLHQPWVFSAARTGSNVEVIAMGPAYKSRAPMTRRLTGMGSFPDVERRTREPLVTVELERLDSEGLGPLPVMAPGGKRVVTTSLADGTNREEGSGAQPAQDLDHGWTRWTMKLVVPAEVANHRLAVRISLATAHANWLAQDKETVDGPLVYLPEPLVTQLEL
jgi:hypothetical protein